MTDEKKERLEFLGDAVLGLVIAEELYQRRRDFTEADLSQAREGIVSGATLTAAAEKLGGAREMQNLHPGQELPDKKLADLMEVLVAAVYLEGGLPAARAFVLSALADEIQAALVGLFRRHPKSILLEETQGRWQVKPEYRIVAIEGAGQSNSYVVEVIAGPVRAQGRGRSKRLAEEEAARQAIRLLPAPSPG